MIANASPANAVGSLNLRRDQSLSTNAANKGIRPAPVGGFAPNPTSSPAPQAIGLTGGQNVDFLDSDSADAGAVAQSLDFLRQNILSQPGAAMFSQANLSPDSVLKLLS